MNHPIPDLFGLVLAGGRSKRMGADKALLTPHGAPQVLFLTDLLSAFCRRVYVSVRHDQIRTDPYRRLSCIPDRPEYRGLGPMGGLLSAFEHQPRMAWMAIACDVVGFEHAAAAALVRRRNPTVLATAFRSPDDGQPEPLAAIYEPAAFLVLKQAADQGCRCPRRVLQQYGREVHLIVPDDPEWVFNCNRPQDWTAFKKRRQRPGVAP